MEHQDSDAAAVAMAALDQPRQVLVPGNDQCPVKACSFFANQGVVVSFGFQNLQVSQFAMRQNESQSLLSRSIRSATIGIKNKYECQDLLHSNCIGFRNKLLKSSPLFV